jgi:HD-like signal output (HDOD) protein
LSRESIIEYAKSLTNLPTLNAFTGKLSSLLRDEDVSFSRLSDLISYDPGLALRLISAANSPWYNRGNQITSISLAISILGLIEVRNLIMCAVFYDGLIKKSGLRKKDVLQFWKHSLLTGFATRRLKWKKVRDDEESGSDMDESFTAGLIHDMGKIPFVMSPELRAVSVISWHNSSEKERKKFGIDHCEVGFFMAREWKLPEGYQNAIRFHHEQRPMNTPACSLAEMVGDANILVTTETDDQELLQLKATVEKEAQGVINAFAT